jgi:hypothetical protein
VSSQLKSKVKGPPKDAAGVFVGINPRTIMGGYKRVDPFGGPISSLFYSCAFKDEKVWQCGRCPAVDWALQALSMDWFLESARKYKLSGMSLAALCEHNALVAFELDRPQVSFVVVPRANLTLALRWPKHG